MSGDFTTDGQARRHFGVYPAIVTDIVDPDNLGRIEVKFPSLGGDGDSVRAWATLLTPYADDNQGFLALPAVDTQVVVAFEAGDLRRPYIVGSAWNGKESLPDTPSAPNNKRRHGRGGEGDGLDEERAQARPRRRQFRTSVHAQERLSGQIRQQRQRDRDGHVRHDYQRAFRHDGQRTLDDLRRKRHVSWADGDLRHVASVLARSGQRLVSG